MQQLERARNHLAVRHDNERQTGILGRNAEHFRRDRLLRLLEDNRQRAVRLDDAVFYIGHGCNVLFAECLYHLVGRQPHLPQLANIELSPCE